MPKSIVSIVKGDDPVKMVEDALVTKDGYEVLSRWPIKGLMECWLPYN